MYYNVTLGWITGASFQLESLCDADGRPVDEATLVQCMPCHAPLPLRYEGGTRGLVHDWNWGQFLLPIIRDAIAGQLLELVGNDVEVLRVVVPSVDEPMSIVNILSRRDCVDELVSFAQRDRENPKKYRSVGRLTVDSVRVGDANLFRVAGYEIAMVASQRLVDAARQAAWTGIDFARQYEAPRSHA